MTCLMVRCGGVFGCGIVVVVEVVEAGVGFAPGEVVGCAIGVDDDEDGVSSVVFANVCVLGFAVRSFLFFVAGSDDCDGVVSSVCCSDGGGGGGNSGGVKSQSLIVSCCGWFE